MQRHSKLVSLFLLVAVGVVVTAAAFPGGATMFHETKEVAGLAVTFSAEPEPALTEEMQFLRWRIRSLDDKEAYTDLQDAEAIIKRDGEEFGPFPVRGSRRDPGLYQTRHIFTAGGEYESVLSFREGEEEEVHTVDFTFRIRDRATLEIPRRKGGGS